jgi:hypothetical protein
MKKVLIFGVSLLSLASCSKLGTSIANLPTIESTEIVNLKAGTTQNFVLPIIGTGDPYIVTSTHLGVASVNGNILTYTAPEVRTVTPTVVTVSNEESGDCHTQNTSQECGNNQNQTGILPGGCMTGSGTKHKGNKHGRKGKHNKSSEQHFTVNFKVTIEPNNDGNSNNSSTFRK